MRCGEETTMHIDYDGMQPGLEIFWAEHSRFDLMARDSLVSTLDQQVNGFALCVETHVSSKMLNGSNSESSGQLTVDIVLILT
jgi:hypothetical protein